MLVHCWGNRLHLTQIHSPGQQVPWSQRFLLEMFLRVIKSETREEVKTSCEAASKRKTSGYLALESTFMQTTGSDCADDRTLIG